MQVNSTKKNNLLKVVRSQRNYDYSSYLIERLIKEKRLNHLIEKIDNIKVKLHNSNIEERGYDDEYCNICLTHSYLNNDIVCTAGEFLIQ